MMTAASTRRSRLPIGDDALKRFRAGAVVSGILVSVGMLLLFLMNVILARRLGPHEFGQFSYVFTLGSMVALVGAVGIPPAAMRYIAQYMDAGRFDLVRGITRWSLTRVLAFAFTVTAALALAGSLEFWSEPVRLTFMLIACHIIPSVLWLWQRFVSLGFQKIALALLPRDWLLPIVITALAFTPALNTATGITIAFAASGIIIQIVACWMLLRIIASTAGDHAPCYLSKQWWRTSLPLSLTSLSQLSMNRWDVLMLATLATMQETGIYLAASKLSLLATPVARFVVTFTGPLISAAYNNGRAHDLQLLLRRSMWLTMGLGLPITLALMGGSHLLVDRIYGSAYAGAGPPLIILATGQLFSLFCVPASTLLWMGGGERAQALINLLGSVSNLGLCVALIPVWGATGAALATSASLAITSLLYVMTGRRVLRKCALIAPIVPTRTQTYMANSG